ncbi:uncharacterized protein ACIBXB_002310 [Morphnus guianensis]
MALVQAVGPPLQDIRIPLSVVDPRGRGVSVPRSTSKTLSVGRGDSCSKGGLYPFTGGHAGAVLHSVSVTNALELGGFVSPVICQLKSLRGLLTPCACCQGCRVRVHPHPRRWPQRPMLCSSCGQRSRREPRVCPRTGADTGCSPFYHPCLWDGLRSGKRDTEGHKGEGRAQPCLGILPGVDKQMLLIPPQLEQGGQVNTSVSAPSLGGDFSSPMKGRRGGAGHFSPPDDWRSW